MKNKKLNIKNNDQSFSQFFRISIGIHNLNKFLEQKFDLSLVQWCILDQLIDRPGSSAHILARNVGVHPSTLTQTLKRLEKKEYIFISKDQSDSRKKSISITRLGKNAHTNTSKNSTSFQNHFAKSSKELQHLSQALSVPPKSYFSDASKVIPLDTLSHK